MNRQEKDEQKSRVEIIVGPLKDPSLHLVTTIENIVETATAVSTAISAQQEALHPPYLPQMAIKMEEDSLEVQRIKSGYSQMRDMERASFDAKIRELYIKQAEDIEKSKRLKRRGDGPDSPL